MIALSANQFQEVHMNDRSVAEDLLSVNSIGTLLEKLPQEAHRSRKTMCVQ